MGNRAQQNQELELWQVVNSTRNKEVQPRSVRQTRGAVSNYSRSIAAGSRTRNARQIEVVRMDNPGTVESVRPKKVKPTGVVRTGDPRSVGAVRTGNPRPAETVRRRTSRPTQQILAISPSAQRTSTRRMAAGMRGQNAGAGARTQTLKRRKAGRRARINQFLAIMWIVAMSAVILFMGQAFYKGMQKSPIVEEDMAVKPIWEDIPVMASVEKKPDIREDFLTISEYNRPGTKLATVKNIFVHYTANKGTSAAQNRSYFENLGITHEREASAHFIIGYEGEIVQCIPLEEEAYAVRGRNGDSISIECCYISDDGSFTKETYSSLVEMLAWLLDKYDLESTDILRHYDCGGKKCPIYYVDHEDAWEQLLEDVENYAF